MTPEQIELLRRIELTLQVLLALQVAKQPDNPIWLEKMSLLGAAAVKAGLR